MREILFRGKSRETGEWLYNMTISRHCYDDNEIFSYYIGAGSKTIDGKTLGQFTGLTDKNGKKIFESDILQGTITSAWNKRLIRCKVVFENGCFISVEKDIHGDSWGHKLRFAKDVEVIGNIHDNPELLEQAK